MYVNELLITKLFKILWKGSLLLKYGLVNQATLTNNLFLIDMMSLQILCFLHQQIIHMTTFSFSSGTAGEINIKIPIRTCH